MLSFSVIICTYNRRPILEQGLMAWSHANRLPDQFIVVDATKDAASYSDGLVKKFPRLFSKTGSSYIITDKPSSTRQRNLGIDLIQTNIVCFADDDTFIEPNYVDKILEVFENDAEHKIGGVNGVAQGQFDNWSQRNYRKTRNYVRHHWGSGMQRIHIPKSQSQLFSPLPKSLRKFPLIHIDRLWGANMSYRTALIKKHRFDERFNQYGLFEDVDISARVGKTHKLVCRLDAKIQHDDSLGQATRPNDMKYFLLSWLNSAYIIEKLFPCKESRTAHRRLFNFINFAPTIMPQKLYQEKIRTFGNQELRSLSRRHIETIQSCNNLSNLEITFSQIQNEIFTVLKQI
jgi:GT2 family glycosyltransferase